CGGAKRNPDRQHRVRHAVHRARDGRRIDAGGGVIHHLHVVRAGGRGVTSIRILIVDDHPVVRDGLRGMLAGDADLEVVGEASDGAEALAVAGSLRPDVILMDLRMPGMGGAAAIAALAERQDPARVLVLTTYDTDTDVVPALEAGATGYL